MAVSLRQLVKVCASRRTPPKTFVELFRQLDEEHPVGEADFIDNLVHAGGSAIASRLMVDYALAVAAANPKRLKQLWSSLPRLNAEVQASYLRRVVRESEAGAAANPHLMQYTTTLLDEALDLPSKLLTQLIFTWCDIMQHHQASHQLDNLVLRIVLSLSDLKNQRLLQYFLMQLQTNPAEPVEAMASRDTVSKPGLAPSKFEVTPTSKKYARLVAAKQAYWTQSAMQLHTPVGHEDVLKGFASLGTSTLASLVGVFVHGALTADSPTYVRENYRNFLMTKLVTIARLSSKGEIEAAIQAVGPLDDGRLIWMQTFVKSCIFHSVLEVSSYGVLFPHNPPLVSLNSELLQFKNDTINALVPDELRKRLIDVNTEFTSLEESGLIPYVSNLWRNFQYSDARQRELTITVVEYIDQFIINRSNDKLTRLLLLLTHSPATLSMVFVALDVLRLVYKLIKYVNAAFEDNDVNDYQEYCSQFGVILLCITQLVEYFELNRHPHFPTIKSLFVVDYLNNFYYRLCDNLTMEVATCEDADDIIIANYTNHINDWIRALFDVNNEEGLSDDMIKLVNVKQISKVIPLVYQQAIVAYNCGKIDIRVLNNGMEFLTQQFLVPCSLSILKWLTRYIRFGNNHVKLVPVLGNLIKSNLGITTESSMAVDTTSDQVMIFKSVLNICAQDIVAAVQKVPKSVEAQEILALVTTNVDDAFLKMKGTESSARAGSPNWVDEWRNHLLAVVDAAPNMRVNEWLTGQVFEYEQQSLATTVVAELAAHHEESRVFLDLMLFVLRQRSVHEKRPPLTPPVASAVPLLSDTTFSSSIDNHYSSIFNVPEDESMENDLLNERLEGQVDSTKSFSAITELVARRSGFLTQLIRIDAQFQNASLNAFVRKVLEPDVA